MEIIIGISGMYLLSVYLVLRYFKIACSKEGIWSHLDVGLTEVLWTITPIMNTIFWMVAYLHSPPKEKYKKIKTDYNKFFKIKK